VFQFNNCYSVVIEDGFWLIDISGVPSVLDCDGSTYDVLLKDNYIIASEPPAAYINTQDGAARIKERNTTFQSNDTPPTMWTNGNSTKNGCIIESWINLFNNAYGSGSGTRCSVDNLGTITYMTTQVTLTSGSGVFDATLPSADGINLFDTVSNLMCSNGDNVAPYFPAPIASSTTTIGFQAAFIGLATAEDVRLNFTAVGF